MAVYNQRNGTKTATLFLTRAEVQEMSYACLCARNYLRATQSASTVRAQLEDVSAGVLMEVFESSNPTTINSTFNRLYAGLSATARSSAASKVEAAANDLGDIVQMAINKGASFVEVFVSYVEIYETQYGGVENEIPRAVSVKQYY